MSRASLAVLAVAIVAEVIGTASLKASNGFTRVWPSVLTVICYGAAFYGLAVAMRTVPVGVVYAVWSGAGIVLIALIGAVMFGERLDAAALAGIGLIIAGVLILNLLSGSMRS